MTPVKALTLVYLTNPDRCYAAFPRPRWAGKLLVAVAGEGAREINNGDCLTLKPDHGKSFRATVIETPVFRLATDCDAMLILEAPQDDVLQGRIIHTGGQVITQLD